jgi:hypothetical protein
VQYTCEVSRSGVMQTYTELCAFARLPSRLKISTMSTDDPLTCTVVCGREWFRGADVSPNVGVMSHATVTDTTQSHFQKFS